MPRALALTLPLTLAAAQATRLPEAEDRLAQGDWQGAARLAEAVGGVDALNLPGRP